MNETRKAEFWNKEKNNAVRCGLCPHRCYIPETAAGSCRVRENVGGELFASGYGLVSSIALDPIEKKPLSMFRPGKNVLSIGGFGCNLRCPFCQNYEISMEYGEIHEYTKKYTPDDIIKLAKQTISQNNIGVAYTYNEPLIGYEFVRDCAELVFEEGLCNILVTNGYINKEPFESLLPLIDAMNIDFKGFTAGFYKKVYGDPRTVMNTIETAVKSCHVEVTTLVIPGENEDDVADIAEWLASVDPEIPLHLSRFFPRYRYSDKRPTPPETILRLRDTAKKYLKNVITGNM